MQPEFVPYTQANTKHKTMKEYVQIEKLMDSYKTINCQKCKKELYREKDNFYSPPLCRICSLDKPEL
jgi:hypothetical protein